MSTAKATKTSRASLQFEPYPRLLSAAESAAAADAAANEPPAEPLVTGCPRPFVEYEKRTPNHFPHTRLPVPWLNTSHVHSHNSFTHFDEKAMAELHAADYLLCTICGEELGHRKVFGHLYGEGTSTGAGMHPRCALLSYHYCPVLRSKNEPHDDPHRFDMLDCDDCGLDLSQSELYTDGTPDVSEVYLRPGYQTLLLSELCALARTDPTGTIVAPFHEVQALALASGKRPRKQCPAHGRA